MTELCFDIETIPQQAPLTDVQSEELDKKLKSYLSRRPDDEDQVEARRLLMGTSPYFGEIVCIGLGYESKSGYKTKALIGDERNILIEFNNIISKFSGIYVSYNGLEFDVPFISGRAMKHKIIINNKNFLETRRFQKKPHFDVKQIVSDWDRYRSVTLSLLCDHLGIPSPKEGEIKAKDVEAAFLAGGIDKIAAYCLRDIVATDAVYQIVRQYTKY